MSSEQTTDAGIPASGEGAHALGQERTDRGGRSYVFIFALAIIVTEIGWLCGIAYLAYRLFA